MRSAGDPEKGDTPVIVLTALGEEKDQLKAFEEEADDYITKPFSFHVLTKRVEAVLRRTRSAQSGEQLWNGRLRLDADAYKVFVDGKLVETTTKEFDILNTLIHNAGRIMTRDMLLDKVWGYDFFGDSRIVDAHIKNIRKKLGISIIRTVKGVGYSLESERPGWEDDPAKGIRFKIFLVTTALLVVSAVLIYLTLYFMLPSYYKYIKQSRLESGVNELVRSVNGQPVEDALPLIARFGQEHNAVDDAAGPGRRRLLHTAEFSFVQRLAGRQTPA